MGSEVGAGRCMKSDSLVLYVVALFSILYHDACFLLLFFSRVLTNLNLCRNHIGVEGAKAIGKALAVNAAFGLGQQHRRRGGGSDSGCGERAGRVRAQDVGVNSESEHNALALT